MLRRWETSLCGAGLQLMGERQRSIIGPVCECWEETVLCLCGLRLCLISLTGGRGRSIRAGCFDTAQKRLWLWLLQSEHWPTVCHHTWQGKADHATAHTDTHSNISIVPIYKCFILVIFRHVYVYKSINLCEFKLNCFMMENENLPGSQLFSFMSFQNHVCPN